MLHRICWPWCECRERRRAIQATIRMIDHAEAVGGWIPYREAVRRDELRRQLKETS